mmetsp:Transcript_776/g.1871  ORF Transcript_776/g.1871 Transcript_776/m.1871 type:complete len:456 (-) Transcript_776:208-1575(-)
MSRELSVEAGQVGGIRSSVAAPAAAVRYTKARASVKSWMQDDARRSLATQNDALQAAIDPEQAKQIVSGVTRFATIMCVIIAIVKVCVYNYTGAAVVKTSALDSAGDLIANMITMYTGYRMMNIDLSRFPIGQNKFEPLGVLVFSTLMATMMFSNILANFGDLLSSDETPREDAIGAFWTGLFGVHQEDDGNVHTWHDADIAFNATKAAFGNISEALRGALPSDTVISGILNYTGSDASFEGSKGMIEKTQNLAAEVEDPELAWTTLVNQNLFLGCCATYKLLLFLYVQFVAIPKSGSTVLQALANDKKNDCVATTSIILVTFLGKIFEDSLNGIKEGAAESIDPLASLILSVIVVFTWGSLVVEQVSCLSQPSVEPEIVEGVRQEVATALRGASCDFAVRAYYSSVKFTVEVDLLVTSPAATSHEVCGLMDQVTKRVNCLEDIERVVVIPKWGV